MTTKIRAAIIGSTGYGGVELIRFLLRHPHVEVTSVISSSSAGTAIAEGYPHLTEIMIEQLDAVDVPQIRKLADVVFTATPSGVSSGLVPQLLDAGLKVIDLSGDFRLKSAEVYEQWYKHKAADSKFLEQAVYGLTEICGEDCRNVDFISNPGCYSTAALLGLVPAIAAGWIDPQTVIIDAKSGVSGAGRGLGLRVHYAEINENLLAYKVNKHQHIPEIEQVLSQIAERAVVISMSTHLVPMTRGILCTMYASQQDKKDAHTEADFVAMYRKYYQGHPFVRVRSQGILPATKEVYGSNYCDIGFATDERTGRVTIVSVLDNLVKGAAGQAIQNLNVMMGWDEAAGLDMAPIYP